ncbi:MAG: Gfo/Idh/MocA family oxidoreductase [Candidatus Promineofilum sp.]|nr:Gfo/Idh/MocA family oxidoreductase [Promineifilum sp.]
MTDLRIGAIGCGYWGPNLIRNFIEIPGAQVIAISDLQQESLNRVAQRFPQIEVATRDYRDLFELNLDAVVIATPPATHYAIARDCMEHGLHVLVEKPITLNSEDAGQLIQVASENDVRLMVGHTFEYNSAVRAIKQMIQDGELGDIYYIDAIRASLGLFQTKANVVWDLAPHDISILRYLLDADPISVNTHGSSCVQEGIEDVAYTTLMFPKNIMAHIRSSWLDPSKQRRITVVGSEKMVMYDDVEPLEKIKIYDKGVKAIRHTDTFGEFSFAYHYGDVIIPYIRFEEPLRVQCQHFLDCINKGEQPQTDGLNGMRVVQVVEAAQRSMKNGGNTVFVNQNGHGDPADIKRSRELTNA